ncbi:MAG: Aminomethyltransferase [Acidimicrobiales bacterium]|nr:MAG: folate-binding protein [Actinomycetota bacterium]MBV6509554.1 Aminomethyltransferase [Acidimicrobiales bacterium]RIK06583.1 MAG: hypothetical protein DCC48_06625 [Acidobacteriota bacterium]
MPTRDDRLAIDYAALRTGVAAVRVPRDAVSVSGSDARAFLQGQLSQDVEALEVGGSAWSLLLQPQGKVVAWLRVTCLSGDWFVLDVDGGYGEPVIERLGRFKLRVECEIRSLGWQCVAVRGPKSYEVKTGDAPVVAPVDWGGVTGVDLLGPEVAIPMGVPEAGREALEIVRIEGGIPAMGSELTEKTIPAEAGIVAPSVSFTKGCYVGQELVARIDSRAATTPRVLQGVAMAAGEIPPVGAVLHVAPRDVGALTSVAESPATGTPVALAYVRREIAPPADAEVVWNGHRLPARIRHLPLTQPR